MPATVTRYVNTASTAGGDGTTNATAGATRAYASLSAAITAQVATRPNLVTNDELLHLLCCGTAADTTEVDITGFTADATRYIIVEGNPDDIAGRHPGYTSTSHYRISTTAPSGHALQSGVVYTRIIGIQVVNTATFSALRTNANNCLMDSVILTCASGNGFEGRADAQTFRNSIAHGCVEGFRNLNTGITTYENCVAVNNSGRGFSDSFTNSSTVRNCYSGGNTGVDYESMLTLTTCRSEDGTQSTTTAAFSTSAGCYFTSITAGSENLHIGSSSALRGVGTNLSGTFTTDIDRNTRSAWDIGVDEFVSAAGPLTWLPTNISVAGRSISVVSSGMTPRGSGA